MIKQSSFNNLKNSLYLIATPIGNLKDITYRAIETLNFVDVIYCEDTRNSLILLNHYNIRKPLKSYHEHNKELKNEEVLNDLKKGLNVGLISDAGTVIISDPGFEICKLAVLNGYNVISIPGASAFLNALVVSNMPSKFLFYGFLNSKQSQRRKELEELKKLPYTLIFYESPHRIKDTIKDMFMIFGEREISISRELTKKFEEIYWMKLSEDLDIELKGEFCIVVKGNLEKEDYLNIDFIELVNKEIENGKSEKEAIKYIADNYKIKKQDLYNQIMKLKK